MSNLGALLEARLAALPEGPLWVGFSGGMDSTVLLHALAGIPATRERGLAALHVDHDSSALSARWAAHCGEIAANLGVAFVTERPPIRNIADLGLEAAWRKARHVAFAHHLPAPGVLALAHHRDDQVETLLLRLLHGAGSEGLAGMRVLRPLKRGDHARWLWRPLLDVPRITLEAYAREHALAFVDDPANADPCHARTRLRGQVLPALHAAFPDADARIAAAAQRLRGESDALELAAHHLFDAAGGEDAASLCCETLRAAEPALARRTLALWLDQLGLPRPPPGIWTQLHTGLLAARDDAQPELRWKGARVRRHRQRLHAQASDEDAPTSPPAPVFWDGQAPLAWQGQHLCFDPPLRTAGGFLVRSRVGGETLQLRGQQRSVKKLFQEAGIAPWQRERLPLLFDTDGVLCSVGARWHADAFRQWMDTQRTTLRVVPD